MMEAAAVEMISSATHRVAADHSMADNGDAAEWVHRMAEGDPSGATELYSAYGQKLYAFAFALPATRALRKTRRKRLSSRRGTARSDTAAKDECWPGCWASCTTRH
jgi:hypothetical protein